MNSRLAMLREEMEQSGIDIYVIPTSDFHESEYVGDYFKARMFVTGFSGSAGIAVVTRDIAGLWTDGRYFIQAEKQLAGSGFDLYRMGEEGVPTIREFLRENLPERGILGFDGRVVNTMLAEKYEQIVDEKKGYMFIVDDLVGEIWEDRPELSHEKIWILEERLAGESLASKLDRIREAMRKAGATAHLLSSLYDIAWILNCRGNDIANVPVFLSYLLITEDACRLFVQEEALTEEVQAYFEENQIQVEAYTAIYDAVAELPEDTRLLMDLSQINYRIRKNLPKAVRILNEVNPSERMKAIKNETELRNTRIAHLKDGVAVTRFMHWLKTNVGKIPMTECSVGEYLNRLRAEQDGFLDLSFENICAYGPNGAIIHYSAEEETCAKLEAKGFLMVDSGGHYREGTTDVTRTFALGPLSEQMKLHFTALCRSNMNLANAKFLYGCSGLNLDILARGPLWDMAMDYKHGTGHGVGHILNVHEGPNGFRWRVVPERKDSGCLEAGMITTDEPGIYLEGEYGIRTENELICVKAEKNEYGQFMEFENITYVPIDLDAIIPEEMSRTERRRLNDYHRMVYEKLKPYMTPEELEWLREYTREI